MLYNTVSDHCHEVKCIYRKLCGDMIFLFHQLYIFFKFNDSIDFFILNFCMTFHGH